MKRKITLLLLAAASVLSVRSQVALSEDFASPFNLTGTGNNWGTSNLSSPTGTLSWFDGANSSVNAFNGTINDLVGVDMFSTAGTGTISNWLISPTVTIYNGAVFSFATIDAFNFLPNGVFPDRLQLRMSTAGTNSTITGGVTGVAPFNDLLLDINPAYSTAAVNNVPLAGTTTTAYPGSWNTYSVQISGVTGTVTGRFAFRYFVENGGPTGTRSDEIGIDAVRFTLPCGTVTAQSYTTCASSPVTFMATGGLAATTYTWLGASGVVGTSQTVTVNAPASGSAVYTVQTGVNGGSCGTTQTVMVTVGTPTVSLTSSAASPTVCSGNPVTLTATGPLSMFGWAQNGAIVTTGTSSPAPNVSVYTFTPTQTGTTTYSVGGFTPPACAAGNSLAITVIASPSLSVIRSASVACTGGSISFTLNGASTYSAGNSALVTNTFSINSGTVAGNFQVLVGGTGANGCVSTGGIPITVKAGPTPSASIGTPTYACRNQTINITANAANAVSYAFIAQGSTVVTTTNPLSFGTGSVGGSSIVKSFTIGAIDADGCIGASIFTLQINTCTGIESIEGSGQASVFPNPFSNELKISGVSGTVQIYNALGQAVITTRVNEDETVNTAELTKGIYILKAYDTNGTLTKTVKLLKN